MTRWQRFVDWFNGKQKEPDPLLPVLREENKKLKKASPKRKKPRKGH